MQDLIIQKYFRSTITIQKLKILIWSKKIKSTVFDKNNQNIKNILAKRIFIIDIEKIFISNPNQSMIKKLFRRL